MPVGRSKLLDFWKWIRSTAGMNGRRGMEVETLIQANSLEGPSSPGFFTYPGAGYRSCVLLATIRNTSARLT